MDNKWMRRSSVREEITCWICDYGVILLALIPVILAGLWLRNHPAGSALPQPAPIGTQPVLIALTPTGEFTPTISPLRYPTGVISTVIPSPILTEESPQPDQTPTATQEVLRKEFVIAFIPVNWSKTHDEFLVDAELQANFFIRESNIGDYFDVVKIYSDEGIDELDLGNEDSLINMLEFALPKIAADRYIGLTSDDIHLNGISEITGWSMTGAQGVMSESSDILISAHELGHTFNLCDEYNFGAWEMQNQIIDGGCPNPYPDACPKSSDEICDGNPTSDGKNSIMGPSGLWGGYGFNTPSLQHLKNVFSDLIGQSQ